MTNKNQIKTIGYRIKELREKMDITQANLAEKAKITPAAISQIEAGDRTPSTPILRNLSSALGVSTDYLLGQTEDVAIKDLLQNEEIQKFFRGYKDLSEKNKELIQKQIEFLKSQK